MGASSAPIRKVRELITLYDLEPNVRDVFVEGPTDAALVARFLKHHNRAGVTVRDPSLLSFEGVAPGPSDDSNREKLLWLADFLHKESPRDLSRNVAFVIDADTDRLRGVLPTTPLVLVTDHASIDSYLSVKELEQFVDIVCLGLPVDGATLMAMMEAPLRQLWAIHMANVELKTNLPMIRFEKLLSLSGSGIAFDRANFLKRYLNTGLSQTQREEFEQRASDIQRTLPVDPRAFRNGEHFFRLLVWTIRQLKANRQLDDWLHVRRILFAMMDMQRLAREPMFAQLLGKIA